MKNKILLILALLISTFSFAQVKPSFGVRAGLSSTGMRGDAVSSLKGLLDYADGMITTNDRSGFFAGVNASVPLGTIMSVEPGLYYTQKGYELKGALNVKGLEFLGVNAKAQLQSQYIDIPVLFKANLGGLEIFAGPQVSYLLHSDLRTTAGLLGINLLNSKMDATSQFSKWDMGVTGGIGYKFKNGVNVMASYDHGLSKVDANQNLNAYNRGFKIGLGVSF